MIKQTKLFPEEEKTLQELYEYNYCNRGIICDVVLADKMKEVIK